MKPYKDDLNMLHFTAAQKQDMVEKLLKTQHVKPKKVKFHRVFTVTVAAAVCLTITSFALPNSPIRKLVSDVFSGIFGGDMQMADTLGAPLGISATDNGITVTAEAVLGDENNLCVVFSILREDGQPILKDGDVKTLMFDSGKSKCLLDALYTGGNGFSYFTDTDPNDAAIQYVEAVSIDSDASLQGRKINLEFRDIKQSQENSIETLVTGKWALSIPLEYTDATRHYNTDKPIIISGQEFEVEDIAISPIGYSYTLVSKEAIPYMPKERGSVDNSTVTTGGGVEFTPSGEEIPISANENSDKRQEYFDTSVATLKLLDGNEYEIGDGGSMENIDDDRLKIEKRGVFEQIIPQEIMQSIVICGQEIPLNK